MIGSSLGGYLAAETALTSKNITQLILLNPAILPPDIDITTIQGMPQSILADMIDPRLHSQKIPATITILRGTLDNVVPGEWVINFAEAQEATITFFHDDHRFSYNLLRLPEIIKGIIS